MAKTTTMMATPIIQLIQAVMTKPITTNGIRAAVPAALPAFTTADAHQVNIGMARAVFLREQRALVPVLRVTILMEIAADTA